MVVVVVDIVLGKIITIIPAIHCLFGFLRYIIKFWIYFTYEYKYVVNYNNPYFSW